MLTEEELRMWLEWAGSKLLSLNLPSPFPKGPHVSWPDYARDHRIAYGYSAERLRPAQATGPEITLMDELLVLTGLIKDVNIRRIVNSRLLVTPVGNRYVYSWAKLAFMMHTDRRRVARLYANGLREIVNNLPQQKVDTFRQTFLRLSL